MVLISTCANSECRMLSVKEEGGEYNPSVSLCFPLLWGPATCQKSLSHAEPTSRSPRTSTAPGFRPTAEPQLSIPCHGLRWCKASELVSLPLSPHPGSLMSWFVPTGSASVAFWNANLFPLRPPLEPLVFIFVCFWVLFCFFLWLVFVSCFFFFGGAARHVGS